MAAADFLAPALDPATVHRTVLPNGLTVIVRRDTSAPVVAMVTYVRAGYFGEPDRVVGIAHVLEHMYFKGTPTRGVGEIARGTKAAGGYLNAGTIYDHTSYYAVLPASGFIAGLDVQFDAYANSLIDAGELGREIEVIIEEAKRKADNQSAVTVETLYELLHDRHRMRRWRIGREPGLRALTRGDVNGFYRNHYKPSNTILVIAGDVEPATALREVEQRYGTLPAGEVERDAGPRESGKPGFRYRELDGDVAQTQFAIGWRTPGTLHADTPLLDLLSVVMGSGRASRLYRAVRERSLAQGISAYDYTPTELGVFVIHAESRRDTAVDAARETWRQVAALRENAPLAIEVERAKRVYESRWLRRLESMEGQANHLAEWEALGGWQKGDEYLARLMSATPDELRDVAARWLDPAHAVMVTYRPRGTAPLAPNAAAARAFLDRDIRSAEPPLAPEPMLTRSARPRAELELEREEAGVRIYRAASGVPILVRRKAGNAIAHAGVYFLGGATEEPVEHAGLTAMLARLAVKGTAARTAAQIAEAGELLGGSIGGGASSDSFGWSISVPVARLGAALELLGDVVQNPEIPEQAFAAEQAIAIADVAALRDDMSRFPMRLATAAAFPAHPYGTPVSGTERSLALMTAAALREWHRMRVGAGAPVVVVVGDVDPDEIARLAASELAALQSRDRVEVPRATWDAAGAQAAESRDKKQTALTMLFPGPTRDDDDRFAAQLLTGIASGLGGRLFEQLRDRQSLCYTVHAFHSERRLAGMLGAYIATSPEKEEVARAGLLRELARFREELVTEEELRRAQTYAIGAHAIRQQSGGAVLGEIIDAWLFGRLAELAEFEDRIRAVTRERIRHVAERHLAPELRVEGVVRGTPQ